MGCCVQRCFKYDVQRQQEAGHGGKPYSGTYPLQRGRWPVCGAAAPNLRQAHERAGILSPYTIPSRCLRLWDSATGGGCS